MSRKYFDDLSKKRRRSVFNDLYRRVCERNDAENQMGFGHDDVQVQEESNEVVADIQERENFNNLQNESENFNDSIIHIRRPTINVNENNVEHNIENENLLHSNTGNGDDIEDNNDNNGEDEDTDSSDDEEIELNDDDDNDDDFDDNSNEPLYDEAPLSVSESMSLILTLFVNHNITQFCLQELIHVINLHCRPEGLHRNNLNKFKKFFSLNKDKCKYKKHYYCKSCKKYLNFDENVCSNCQTARTKKQSYFVEIPIKQQLKTLYKRRNFCDALQHRHIRIEEGYQNDIRDLYDGKLYVSMIDNGFLSNQNNISLTWYTDGVPVFKSSMTSMWPMFLSINELPFHERTHRHNILLIGLWFGNEKPDVNLFILKLYEQFEELKRGINVTLYDGSRIKVQGALLVGTCDLPAKSLCLNMIQFNGAYGCLSCYCRGETFYLNSGGTTHVYPYVADPVMRTLRGYNEDVEVTHMGVKGPCIFSKLMPDLFRGMAIDRMHCIDGGVVKKLLSLWFNREFNNEVFSLLAVKDVINERLLKIKPPKFVHRMPRKIEEFEHWKASELKIWLLYYAIPILYGIMRQEYFENLLRLVAGITLLSTDNISDRNIDEASNLLHKFVVEFQYLYGLRHCSINIHLILHLTECVRNLGPLWGYSCYPYEDLNGKFLKIIHGTRHIDSQVINAHSRWLKIQRCLNELQEGPIRDFCFDTRHGVRLNENLFCNCYSVGVYHLLLEMNPAIERAISHLLPLPPDSIQCYLRLLKDGKLYVSEKYTRALQTSSSHVMYNNCTELCFGLIECFLKIAHCAHNNSDNCDCHPTHVAIIQKFQWARPFVALGTDGIMTDLPHIYEYQKLDDFIAVPISNLHSICFNFTITDDLTNVTHTYIAIPINTKEFE